MDIRGAVDAAVPTNIIAAKAAEVRANLVNWQSYLQWVHITAEHYVNTLYTYINSPSAPGSDIGRFQDLTCHVL